MKKWRKGNQFAQGSPGLCLVTHGHLEEHLPNVTI